MPRIAGVDIPADKPIWISLTYIYGVGRTNSRQMLKEAGIEKGSAVPNRTKVGKVTRAQLKKIAEIKMADLNAADLEGAMRMIAGTARSMGLEVAD